jgi:hypothetical protein
VCVIDAVVYSPSNYLSIPAWNDANQTKPSHIPVHELMGAVRHIRRK